MALKLYEEADVEEAVKFLRKKAAVTETKNLREALDSVLASDKQAWLSRTDAGYGNLGYKEVWLERMMGSVSNDFVTDIDCYYSHSVYVRAFCHVGNMCCPLCAYTSRKLRYGFSLLSSSGKIQYFTPTLGNFLVDGMDFALQTEVFMKNNALLLYRQYGEQEWRETDISIDPLQTAVGKYNILSYAGNTDMSKGFFREAKIFDEEDALIHHLVPIKMQGSEDLYILDKVAGGQYPVPNSLNNYTWWDDA